MEKIELDKRGYKDIKVSNKIKDKAIFERIEKFIINNFGAIFSQVTNALDLFLKVLYINRLQISIKYRIFLKFIL